MRYGHAVIIDDLRSLELADPGTGGQPTQALFQLEWLPHRGCLFKPGFSLSGAASPFCPRKHGNLGTLPTTDSRSGKHRTISLSNSLTFLIAI